jgi:hypothetical protein
LGDPQGQVLRPSVAFPDAEAIFRAALDFAGPECKVSDKGAYAQASIDKFGGLEQIGMALRLATVSALLQKFRDKTPPGDGVFDEGVFLRDKRRYLNFACIQKILGNFDFARSTIDEYIGKGILYRGFIFKCCRCADVSWFSIEEVSHTFTCRRCGTQQQYVHSSWNYPDEPSWFYKLDEIVYHMLQHDGHVSILALDKMRRQSVRDFQFAPELQIRPKGSDVWDMEIDICCIASGHTQIGEAKSVSSLKSDHKSPALVAARYRVLAEKLGAAGVIFATSAAAWDTTSNSAIETEFDKNPYLRVIRLGYGNLMD